MTLNPRLVGSVVLILGTSLISLAGSGGSALAQPSVRQVATTGVDSGDCTSAPCKTIAYAIRQASPGDTIDVASGSYCAPFAVSTDNLTIEGSGPTSTVVLGRAVTGQNAPCDVTTTLVTIDPNVAVSIQNIAVDCDDSGSSATVNGGGIANDAGANLTLNNVDLAGNATGGDGGGIWNAGTLDMENSALDADTAVGNGGGIANTASGTAYVNASTIDREGAVNLGGPACKGVTEAKARPAKGGGIYNGGALTMTGSSVENNTAVSGGGVYDTGTSSVANLAEDAIFDNNGPFGSGGMYVDGGAVSLTNVTVADNGGGLDVKDGGVASLLNASIVYNVPRGITSVAGTTVRLENSLLADNGNGLSCTRPVLEGSWGGNVAQDDSCGLSAAGDQSNVSNPEVEEPGGGPTLTAALDVGSAAIGADTTDCPPTDERGVARSSPCDAGAYQTGLGANAASISGVTYSDNTTTPLPDTEIQVCGTGPTGCATLNSDHMTGQFEISNLPPDTYTITAWPPDATLYSAVTVVVTLTPGEALTGENFVLPGPLAPPPSVTIEGSGGAEGGVPVIDWDSSWTINQDCGTGFNGTASYSIAGTNVQTGVPQTSDGSMAQAVSGVEPFYANIAPLDPIHGEITVTITCAPSSGPPTETTFNCYIDPSGTVVNQSNQPITGATVTLLEGWGAHGVFSPVPNGSAVMDPSNRRDPDTTDGQGRFGWNVLAGYYQVKAAKAGCTDPSNPAHGYALTSVYKIPPPALGIVIHLHCGLLSTELKYSGPAKFTSGKRAVFKATLLSGTTGIPGELVKFSLGSGRTKSCAGTTNSKGIASCSVTHLRVTTGKHKLKMTFGGDTGSGKVFTKSSLKEQVRIKG